MKYHSSSRFDFSVYTARVIVSLAMPKPFPALPLIADVRCEDRQVRKVPNPEVAPIAKLIST